jgi:hypothetical protein
VTTGRAIRPVDRDELLLLGRWRRRCIRQTEYRRRAAACGTQNLVGGPDLQVVVHFVHAGDPFDDPLLESSRTYVSANGLRFLMIREAEIDQAATAREIVVVQHWLEERKRLAGTTGGPDDSGPLAYG